MDYLPGNIIFITFKTFFNNKKKNIMTNWFYFCWFLRYLGHNATMEKYEQHQEIKTFIYNINKLKCFL